MIASPYIVWLIACGFLMCACVNVVWLRLLAFVKASLITFSLAFDTKKGFFVTNIFSLFLSLLLF